MPVSLSDGQGQSRPQHYASLRRAWRCDTYGADSQRAPLMRRWSNAEVDQLGHSIDGLIFVFMSPTNAVRLRRMPHTHHAFQLLLRPVAQEWQVILQEAAKSVDFAVAVFQRCNHAMQYTVTQQHSGRHSKVFGVEWYALESAEIV